MENERRTPGSLATDAIAEDIACSYFVVREEDSRFPQNINGEKGASKLYKVNNFYCQLTGRLCAGALKEESLYNPLLSERVVGRCPAYQPKR